MSIRLIAKDLYLLRQEVEKLTDEAQNAPFERQVKIKDILRKKNAELKKMQRILDGAKEPPPYRKPR